MQEKLHRVTGQGLEGGRWIGGDGAGCGSRARSGG